MTWQTVAIMVLDKAVKREQISSDERSRLSTVVHKGLSDLAFNEISVALKGAANLGWNKVWAGSILFGWWSATITSEPLRLVALEVMNDSVIGNDIRNSLLSRWNGNSSEIINFESSRLCKQFALGDNLSKLSPADLRFLQRINLDSYENVFIEKWRWSHKAGVAFLSDEGRISISPELACLKIVEAMLDGNGLLSDRWLTHINSICADDMVFPTIKSDHTGEILKILEFWGSGQEWSGGFKLNQTLNEPLRRIANHFSHRTTV